MTEKINAIANLIITISLVFFIIALFGSNNKTVNRLSIYEKIFIRIALSATCCGSLFNMLTLSNPPLTEVILNVGLGLLFSWAVYFHWKYFILNKNKTKR
jgi:RsiW-degrading membrane proteinase PrsW (M82 family)